MRREVGLLLAAGVLIALPGCRTKDTPGNAANGKKLFVAKCGSCHTLARAGTKGTVGPNLDAAFAQDRRDGYPRDGIRGLVHRQILYPGKGGEMPAKVVTGEDAYDVATYVAQAVAKPGKDTGILASIGQAAQKKNIAEQGGKLTIPADPSGQLAYLVGQATAKPGKVQIDSPNKASIGHDIAIQQGTGPSGPILGKGEVVSNGGVSQVTVDLKPGKYTFFCTVPGHREAGMVGKIVVK